MSIYRVFTLNTCKREKCLAISVFLLLISVIGKSQSTGGEQELKKLVSFFDSKRKLIREERCGDCSYIILYKLYFNQNKKLIKVVPSYSSPGIFSNIPQELINLNLNWSLIRRDLKDSSTKLIQPVFYITERNDGALFSPTSSMSKDIFEFEDGGLFDSKGTMTDYLLSGPIYIHTFSKNYKQKETL